MLSATFTRTGLLAGAAVTLAGFAAALILNGGWQPVAAAVSILGGSMFLLSFVALGAAADRPRSDRPDWAQGGRLTAPSPRRRHAALSASASRSASSATLVDAKMAPAASPSA